MLNEHKIVESDFVNRDIIGLPSNPSEAGIGAVALQNRFDASVKQIVTPKFNALIDELRDTGAGSIGVSVPGIAGYTVQEVLESVKALLDEKETQESHAEDMATKLSIEEANALVKSIDFNDQDGKFTFTKYDGTTVVIDTALEKVALNCRLDGQQFVLTLVDGTEQRVDLSNFLTQYEAIDSDQIHINLENGTISATIKDGAIEQRHLGLDIGEYVAQHAQDAANSADAAAISEQNARYSELSAAESATSASQSASTALSSANYVQSEALNVYQASQIAQGNADRVVSAVSDFASDIVSTGNEQPTSEYNRLWFPGITTEVEIPTAHDIQEEVARQVGPGIDQYLIDKDFKEYLGYKVARDSGGIYFED